MLRMATSWCVSSLISESLMERKIYHGLASCFSIDLLIVTVSHLNSQLVLEFTAPWSEPCKYMSKVLDGNPPGRGLAYELQDYADFCSLDITKFRVTLVLRARVHYLNGSERR